MLQVYVLNVSVVFKRMLQVVYLDVAYVALVIHVHCKCMFLNVSAVSNICYKYFYLDVAYIVVTYTYVGSVCFQMYVVSVLSGC